MDVLELAFAAVCVALGTTLVLLRERLGAQAKAEGHGVSAFWYLVIGVTLVAAGAFVAVNL
jgi:hypothetical protein